MAIQKSDLTGGGSGSQKKRKEASELGPLLPGTLPVPELREIPHPTQGWKTPAEIVPPGEPEPEEESAAQEKNTAAKRVSGVKAAASSSASAAAAPVFRAPDEDAEAARRYEDALAELERLRGEAPRYDSRYDAEIRALYERIASREPFRYDSAADPLYQQYRQSYTELGRAAMRDTMGQAAGLTGGYGSSYAQSVGQQQYDAYLRRLADVLPETYGAALEAWQADGQELQRRYDTLSSLEKSDYERYLDELGQYNRELDRARSDADTAYERKLAAGELAYRRAVDDYNRRLAADKLAYQRAKDGAKASSSGGSRKKAQSRTAGTAGPKAGKNLKKKSGREL